MGTNIKIDHALKKYGSSTIIPDLSLDVHPGEFFTLLGPSGCGKTTLLRMIAGFNSIEGGDFYFGEKRINDIDPAKRNIGMVFQNYAIFPHMTVRKNVEFGLKNRHCPKDQITAKTNEIMKLIHIDEYADRMPDRLSGGQQQRVALARALVIEPDVLLMDEPLSNLDAKLRVEMRNIIKQIQNSVGITTVYVTHDQEEAMAVSDRIAVMRDGVIQHVGTPKDIYQRPSNQFVATFIGRTNIMSGRLEVRDQKTYLAVNEDYAVEFTNIRPEEAHDQNVVISARPEELIINHETEEGMRGVVRDSVFLGLNTHYYVTLDNGTEVEIIQESTIHELIDRGEAVRLVLNCEKVNLFTEDGEKNILQGVKDQKCEERVPER